MSTTVSIGEVMLPTDIALQPGVTTVILTYNEFVHIERAIASAKAFSRDIVVIDSFSNDGTVEQARAAGARVLQNAWTNHSRQFAWGLEHGGILTQWVLRLDADEIIGPDLARRINDDLPAMPSDIAGILFNRRHIFMDRWIKHGGRYPLWMLRLWRNGQGRVEDRWMDEHVEVWGGRTIRMEGEFSDASRRDLTFFVAKHNDYASREAVEILALRYGLFDRSSQHVDSGVQAKRKRVLKSQIYNRLPLGFGPLLYFLFRYFIQMGILDGQEGFVYHVLQGFWYRLLVNAKAWEFNLAIRSLGSREERLEKLAQLTGFKL